MKKSTVLFGGLLAIALSGTALAQEKVSVTYRTWIDPAARDPRAQAQTQIIEDFERKNPGIDIKIQLVPWQDMHTSIIRDASTGQGPCLVRPLFETLPAVIGSGALMPLDKYIGEMSAEEKADFLLPWDSTVFDGHKMSFPLEHRIWTLMYRKDVFEAAGLQPPKTWEEYKKVAKALTKDGMYGTAVGLMNKGSADAFFQFLVPYIWSHGEEPFDAKGTALTPKSMLTGIELLKQGVAEKFMPPSMVSMEVDHVMEAFMTGRLAFIILGQNRLGAVLKSNTVKGKVGLAPLPSGIPGKVGPSGVTGWQIAMMKSCKTPDAAWKFIKHITSPEMSLLNTKIGNELPTRKSLLNDPYFQTADGSVVRFAADYVNSGGKPMILLDRLPVWSNDLAVATQKIVSGGAPLEATINETVARYNRNEK